MLQIEKNHNLKALTTLRTNHVADFYVEVTTAEELLEAIQFAKDNTSKYYVLGGGSNVLFAEDYHGLIIHIKLQDYREEIRGDRIRIQAGAGINWHKLVRYSVKKNWFGLENLSLIPGTVGAAPIQNIGAYGVEVKEVIHAVSGVDLQTGNIELMYREDCAFDYRNSIFKSELKERFIITQVWMDLSTKGSPKLSYGRLSEEVSAYGKNPDPVQVSDAVIRIRNSKLPDPESLANAGSFFKNPVISKENLEKLKVSFPEIRYFPYKDQFKLSAAWLIEKCGWKGKRVGEAGVYDNHALILVNHGKASGADILSLADSIEKDVKNEFGVSLEKEVNLVQ